METITHVPFQIRQLREKIFNLRQEVLLLQTEILKNWGIESKTSGFFSSATNLASYIAFRRRDIREIQISLSSLGLSSLGRCEPHVLTSLDAVLQALRLMDGGTVSPDKIQKITEALFHRMQLLESHTKNLLGPMPRGRWARIMVTMPTEASENPGLVREFLDKGMDCARINCAHDSPDHWKAIIDNINKAQGEIGRPCKILMDLAGPRIRTGPLPLIPGVLHIKPLKDHFGNYLSPGVLCLTNDLKQGSNKKRDDRRNLIPAHAPIKDYKWLKYLSSGDHVTCIDLRGKKRDFKVLNIDDGQRVFLECERSIYLKEGDKFIVKKKHHKHHLTTIGPISPEFSLIRIWKGDFIRLVKTPVSSLNNPPRKRTRSIAHIQCLPPEVIDCIRIGDRVWIDEGKIGGVVKEIGPGWSEVLITHAHPKGVRILPEKGMNFPDSCVTLPSLGEKDLEDLKFAVKYADIIGYSFIRNPEDMEQLVKALSDFGGESLGIIAKIENQSAFLHLPEIIIKGAMNHPFGVMIARGDLAVEIGYQRLAEVQEEILWLCEAAHIPVIWATQVLETLVKEGIPSRAEITDAAMAERADCVMLNKGPFLGKAISVLNDVIGRMEEHQNKKTPRLRALKSW